MAGGFSPSRAAARKLRAGRSQHELRELVRYRRSLIEEQSWGGRIEKRCWEGASIKLRDVATDVLGKSGRQILEALIRGKTNPDKLADLARDRLKKKRTLLTDSLYSVLGPHQRMKLAVQLQHIDFLNGEIARLDREIEERMRTFEETLERMDETPGLGRTNAEEILAEIGLDMSRYPTAAHLAL